MLGKSTCGNEATGKALKATNPASINPIASSEVAIGLRTNGSEKFIFSNLKVRHARLIFIWSVLVRALGISPQVDRDAGSGTCPVYPCKDR